MGGESSRPGTDGRLMIHIDQEAEPGDMRADRSDIPKADFEASQVIENVRVLEAKKRPPNPSRFKFEEVNDATWKLTNGEWTNVPASHGQWAGYRTTKAIAWVIGLAPGKWLARCGDETCGPELLKHAKANATAMAKGGAGDYRIRNPISHLNELQARLLDAECAESYDAAKWELIRRLRYGALIRTAPASLGPSPAG